MPLYEYECIKGRHRFELIRKFSDPPVTRCIRCKSKVRKLLSLSAIAFKGSGWYVTDYGRKGSSEGSVKAEPGASGADPKAETSSQEKGEGKGKGKGKEKEKKSK